MDVKTDLKITVKGVSKEILMLGTESMKDCLKIIFVDGLKSKGYECDISDLSVEEVVCRE